MAQIFVFLGPPGAGKGTQARLVARQLGIPHISTGDMLRDAAGKRTSFGLAAKAKMDKGKLVPDDVVCRIVEERLSQPDCRDGAILDGFPRTIAQAKFLDGMLERAGLGEPVVVDIDVSTECIVERLKGRRTCQTCGEIFNVYLSPPRQPNVCDKDGGELVQRADDNEESIRIRLKEYKKDTLPLIEYYLQKGALRQVEGCKELDEITESILDVVKTHGYM